MDLFHDFNYGESFANSAPTAVPSATGAATGRAGPSQPVAATASGPSVSRVPGRLARRKFDGPDSSDDDYIMPREVRSNSNMPAKEPPSTCEVVERPVKKARKAMKSAVPVVPSDPKNTELPVRMAKKGKAAPTKAVRAAVPIRKVIATKKRHSLPSQVAAPAPPPINPLDLFSGPLQEILAMAKTKADEATQEEIAELKRDLRMAEQGRRDDGARHTLELIAANTAHVDEMAKLEEEVKKLRKENAELLLADAEERIKREALKELEEENKVLAEKNVRLRTRVADMSEACQCGAKA